MGSPPSQSLFPLNLLGAIWGACAFAGYYSDLLQPHVPAWLAVGVFILPVLILNFVRPGEAPDRLVIVTHRFAAALFLVLAAGMEIGSWRGYRPEGLAFYRVLAHLAWTFSWAGVLKDVRARRKNSK
jgi:hypothetical protein